MDKTDLNIFNKIIEKYLENDLDDLYDLQIKFLSNIDYSDILGRMALMIYIGLPLKTLPVILKKGTKLYRIRRGINSNNINDEDEWKPNPKKTKNRFNDEGEEALYLASSDVLCLLELHIKKDEDYAIAQYEVLEDINLGTFDKTKTRADINVLSFLNVVMMIINSSEENITTLKLLDKTLGKMTFEEIFNNPILNYFAPFKLGLILKGNDPHFYTRMLSKNFKTCDLDGIRYSSSFLPLGSPLFFVSEYNYVLYSKGIKKIKFLSSERKTSKSDYSIDVMVKLMMDNL